LEVASTFDSNSNKVVIAYRDDTNNYGTAVVATVNGSSLSYGTPVVFNAALTTSISATFDTNSNKVVIGYTDDGNSGYGTAIVGTVSGTSISFGTATVYESADTVYTAATFDSANNKVVIAYRDNGNNNRGTAIVGTVSGTSISFGTAVVFMGVNATNYISAAFDTVNNKVVVAAANAATAQDGEAVVGTVSGTSISFGGRVVFSTSRTDFTSTVFDPTNGKIVIAYSRQTADTGQAIVGTVSGTSISFGTQANFDTSATNSISATFDSINDKVVISYVDDDSLDVGTLVVGTVSGTSISFGTPVVFDSADIIGTASVFDPSSNKVVVAYIDFTNTSSKALTFQNESTNSLDFIGITSEAISDTATGPVNVKGGINEAQTGLTIGSDYYVQADGTLATTPDKAVVKAGQAISATTINMMDLT
jgi:hypothetical protein